VLNDRIGVFLYVLKVYVSLPSFGVINVIIINFCPSAPRKSFSTELSGWVASQTSPSAVACRKGIAIALQTAFLVDTFVSFSMQTFSINS